MSGLRHLGAPGLLTLAVVSGGLALPAEPAARLASIARAERAVADTVELSFDLRRQDDGTATIALYSEPASLRLVLVGPPGDYEVELRAFGVVHLLRVRGERGAVQDDGRRRWTVDDPWLLVEPGVHELRARVWRLEPDVGVSGPPLLEVAEPITVLSMSREDFDQTLHYIQENLGGAALQRLRVLVPERDPYTRDGETDADRVRRLAEERLDARIRAVFQRTYNLSWCARLHEADGRGGDALALFRQAERIWLEEGARVVHEPPLERFPLRWERASYRMAPAHLRGLSDWYARRMELDRAVHYLQLEVAFLQEQGRDHPALDAETRRACLRNAAFAMLRIADLHLALGRDRAGYELWHEKYLAARPPDEPVRAGGLLGQ